MDFSTLPQETFRFLVLIGIIIIAYFHIKSQEDLQKATEQKNKFELQLQKSTIEFNNIKSKLEEVKIEVGLYYKDKGLKIPADFNISKQLQSNIDKLYSEGYYQKDVSLDTIKSHYNELKKLLNRSSIKDDEMKLNDIQFEQAVKDFNSVNSQNRLLIIFGCVFLIIGLISWTSDEIFRKKILLGQNYKQISLKMECNCCGKTFSSFVKRGTENDGKESFGFCINCYKNGEFTEIDLTLATLKERVSKELTSQMITAKKRKRIIKNLEKLDRWKFNYS